MIVKTDKNTYTLSLNLWRGGWDAGYEPDCFGDLCNGFAVDIINGDVVEVEPGVYQMSEDYLSYICSFWEDECRHANSDPDYEGDGLMGLSEDAVSSGDSWVFSCDELSQ